MRRIVEVTWHSVERFRELFPVEAGSASAIRLLIAKEVESALDHGRYATKQPGWLGEKRALGKRNGNERDRTLRFVWPEDENRAYLVDRRGATVRVVTSYAPRFGR